VFKIQNYAKIYNLFWLTNQPWENKSHTVSYKLEKGEIIQDFTGQ
jgi:hypothetical protein